jgi:hypothetical protein
MARPITTAGTTLQESDPRRQFTDAEITEALTALAFDGSFQRVSDQLAKQWHRAPSHMTLRRWTQTYAEQYALICEREQHATRQLAAARYDALVRQAQDVAADALQAIDVDNVTDLGGLVRNVATASGIYTDKANVLRGMPTEIVAHIDIDENLDAIQRLSPSLIVETGDTYDIPHTDIQEITDPPKPPND